MAEILLSSDELTVLGGPAEVSVDLDFGPQGNRGSLILYGLGKPASVQLPETPQIYDTYINLLPSDSEYLFMYQYTAGAGGSPAWERRFKLIPNTYSENLSRTFVSGEVQIAIPIAAIVPEAEAERLGAYQAEDFNIQCTVLNVNPVSVSVTVGDIDFFDSLMSLPITIKAIEYDNDEWSALTGQKMVHLSITVV
jgi:hypothetical protein